jgi:hypothetical protein
VESVERTWRCQTSLATQHRGNRTRGAYESMEGHLTESRHGAIQSGITQRPSCGITSSTTFAANHTPVLHMTKSVVQNAKHFKIFV